MLQQSCERDPPASGSLLRASRSISKGSKYLYNSTYIHECSADLVSLLSNGPCGLIMAFDGGLQGIDSGLTKSTDHPSGPQSKDIGTPLRPRYITILVHGPFGILPCSAEADLRLPGNWDPAVRPLGCSNLRESKYPTRSLVPNTI